MLLRYYITAFSLLRHKVCRDILHGDSKLILKIFFLTSKKKISKRIGLEYFQMLNDHEKRVILKNGDVSPHEEAPSYLEAGPDYQDLDHFSRESEPEVKAIAYYLPQYHPFPENDAWWGKGFTEWRNVVRGRPRFKGHQQPKLPRDLGYYDLRLKETLEQQAKLARNAGLEGFCYYYYWFNGKRLMNAPTDLLLENKDIELPFCLMWANENWTKTWDGMDDNILISQDYLEEHDEAFIEDLAKHFQDSRYICLDGRPLYFIYRPSIIPEAVSRIQKWRDLLENKYGLKPLIFMVQAFDDLDPDVYKLDGAIEFPPHKLAKKLKRAISPEEAYCPLFNGKYLEYDDLVQEGTKSVSYSYDLIRAVTPSWDNEARRPNKGLGFINSHPDKYEQWLRSTVRYAKENPVAGNHSFVGINAWNEWAEGATLEPDVYWGSAYLNATKRALYSKGAAPKKDA